MSDLTIYIPINIRLRGGRRVALQGQSVGHEILGKLPPSHDVKFLIALGRAFHWQKLIDIGVVKSGSEIARLEGLHHSTVNELLRLCLLAPDIITMMMDGLQPRTLTLIWFQRNPLPVNWDEQRAVIERFAA